MVGLVESLARCALPAGRGGHRRRREGPRHPFRGACNQLRPNPTLTLTLTQGVEHVINYDMPKDIDSYTHRIGRTVEQK